MHCPMYPIPTLSVLSSLLKVLVQFVAAAAEIVLLLLLLLLGAGTYGG